MPEDDAKTPLSVPPPCQAIERPCRPQFGRFESILVSCGLWMTDSSRLAIAPVVDTSPKHPVLQRLVASRLFSSASPYVQESESLGHCLQTHGNPLALQQSFR